MINWKAYYFLGICVGKYSESVVIETTNYLQIKLLKTYSSNYFVKQLSQGLGNNVAGSLCSFQLKNTKKKK